MTAGSGDRSSGHFRGGARLQHLAALAVVALCTSWSFMQVSGSSPAVPVFPAGIGAVRGDAVVVAVPERPELRAEATAGRTEPLDAPPLSRKPVPARPPLPSVDGIVISGTLRLAIVGGNVVAAGDSVGVRAIARIERDGVVLREPSGREVYVAIRARKPPPLGS